MKREGEEGRPRAQGTGINNIKSHSCLSRINNINPHSLFLLPAPGPRPTSLRLITVFNVFNVPRGIRSVFNVFNVPRGTWEAGRLSSQRCVHCWEAGRLSSQRCAHPRVHREAYQGGIPTSGYTGRHIHGLIHLRVHREAHIPGLYLRVHREAYPGWYTPQCTQGGIPGWYTPSQVHREAYPGGIYPSQVHREAYPGVIPPSLGSREPLCREDGGSREPP